MRKDIQDWILEKLGDLSGEKERVRVRLLELRLQQAVKCIGDTLRTRQDLPRMYWKAASKILKEMMVSLIVSYIHRRPSSVDRMNFMTSATTATYSVLRCDSG